MGWERDRSRMKQEMDGTPITRAVEDSVLKDAVSHLKRMNITVTAEDFMEEWDEKSSEAIAVVLNAVIKGKLK